MVGNKMPNNIFTKQRQSHLKEQLDTVIPASLNYLKLLETPGPFVSNWNMQMAPSETIDYPTICVGNKVLVRYDISPPIEALVLPCVPDLFIEFRDILAKLAFSNYSFTYLKNLAKQQLRMQLTLLSEETWKVRDTSNWASIVKSGRDGSYSIFLVDSPSATKAELDRLAFLTEIPKFAQLFKKLLTELETDPVGKAQRQKMANSYYAEFHPLELFYQSVFTNGKIE